MTSQALFLGVALLAISAYAAPNTSTGNTSEKVLDVAPAKFLAFHGIPSETSSASDDVTSRLATEKTMEAAIENLMLGKGAFGATPMGGSVKQIVDVLTKTMMPKVLSSHKSDQSTLNRLANALKKCSSTKISGLNAAKSPFNVYQSNSRAHKKCRNSQAVLFSSKEACLVTQKSLYTQKGLKCQFFASVGRKLGTTKDNIGIMKKAGSETTEGYIRRISATVCGKHVHGTKGEKSARGGWGGGLANSFLDQYLKAKDQCDRAKKAYDNQVKLCKQKVQAFNVKKGQCNQYQTLMDGNSCKSAVLVKDVCEAYAGCYDSRKAAYMLFEKGAKAEEKDRKAEWRGLKRMSCLIGAFGDGKVTGGEVDACKKKTVSTAHLTLKYPRLIKRAICALPRLYPATGAYKRAEFAPLPTLAKGLDSAACAGMDVVSTTPKKGSPKNAKCTRVALNGQYSAGALLRCVNGLDVRRSYEKNSCPEGTKIFSPASRGDWKTFLNSASVLRSPHWIVDVTRPANGCGGCKNNAMNSGNRAQKSWVTSDGSPWWLRSSKLSEPNGDYHANCFLGLSSSKPKNENAVTWNDHNCAYHSKSYYCQPMDLRLKPKAGPASCKCSKVELTGKYSAGLLVKCMECLSVSKSTQTNSCPKGMKLFSPANREDWKTFLGSARPLRAPHWIIDITRPSRGCGGCTGSTMKSTTPQQATWKTSDGSPWWLRSTVYSEPNGDYVANCYLDLWKTPSSPDTIQFNDGSCSYHSRSYYCQSTKEANKRVTPPKVAPPPPKKEGFTEKVYYIKNMKKVPTNFGRYTTKKQRVIKQVTYYNSGSKWSGFSVADNFAVRWTGTINVKKTGRYTWKIGSDDGSKLKLKKNGRWSSVVNNDGLHGFRYKESKFSVSKKTDIALEFFEKGGGAGMLFAYKGADTGNKNVWVGGCCSKVYPN